MPNNIPKRVAEGSPVEASFSQERLWFMDRLAPGSSTFNILIGFRIRGTIDGEALVKSIQEIVRRHEILRTNLFFSDGKVFQSASPALANIVEHVDLSAVPKETRLEEARRMAVGWAENPYDLSKDALFRTVLFKIENEEHLLAVLSHHSVFDGWSSGIFASELVSLYSSFIEGKHSPLPELEIQYGDYSDWQRRRLEARYYEQEWEYWRGRLGGELPVLELQTDRPRGVGQASHGDMITLMIPGELRDRLKRLGMRNGCTLYMTLLAAFYVFLRRYSGGNDLVVGCPVAGRVERTLEGMMGFFINTLPIRADLSGNPTFTELLKNIRRLCLEAYSNQNIPFDKVVERLSPQRDLSHSPVYQVLFQLRNYPKAEMVSERISLEPFEFGWVTSQVDLMLDMLELADGLLCKLEYPSELFERTRVERMARHWVRILEGIADDPHTAISKLPLITNEEFSGLVFERNRTQTDYPRGSCVHEIFEERASEAPDALAITHRGFSLTYGEVNERANKLAHLLLEGGLSPGEPVGVCMERSPEMVISYIAILKAGGVYVPLDPNDPPNRLGVIINDIKGRVVVTVSRYENRVPEGSRRICLDKEFEAIGSKPGTNVDVHRDPAEMAYIVYTSGSTGTPKGVCCPHRGIVRLVVNTNYVRFVPGDTVVHSSNPTFDPTTFEVWGALLNGARLLIVDREVLLSNEEFTEVLRRERADVLFMTTTLFHLKARDAPGTFGSLREVFVGGEAMDPSSARSVLETAPPNRLINFYGPTENTGFSTFYDVREVPKGTTTIPIGKNISNSTSYILDRDLQPVPVGVKGEIYVSGDGVGLGYFDKPELTASSFLPNPFSPGKTMYKTGDLGRLLEDGNIEYMGRSDLQVKIRGFRVEVGEVEAVLSSHPSVKAGSVIVKEGNAKGDRRLVAYVLPTRGGANSEEIRRYMKERLPDYMVPTSFVILDNLPLTPTGKIDRRSLPEPPASVGKMDAKFAREGSVEGRLTRLWDEVLGVANAGVDDDFFGLGGHSLMAVRLFTRIEEEFGARLPIATLFRAPTIAQLAREIEGARMSSNVSLVPLRRTGSRPALFLIHAEDGDVFNYGRLVDALGEDQPVYGLKAAGLQDQTRLPETLEEAAAAYIKEVKTVQPEGPYHMAGFCSGALIAHEMAQQLQRSGDKVGLVGALDFEPAGPQKGRRERRGRGLFMREILFIGANLWNYAKRRRVGGIKLSASIIRLEKIWLQVIGVISSRESILPGEATQLPATRKRVIFNLSDMTRSYRMRPYEGIITVFKKQMLPTISSPDPTDGWRGYAMGGIVVIPIKGRLHGDMLRPPGVEITARRLRERIDWHEAWLRNKV